MLIKVCLLHGSMLEDTYIVASHALFLLTKSVFSMLCVRRRSSRVRSQENCEDARKHVQNLANKLAGFFNRITYEIRDKWVPVTTAWRVLRLRMEERPPLWRVAANMLNKESRTADKGWSSSLRGLGEVLTTPHRKIWLCYET